MHSPRTEENFPLLLLFLEEGRRTSHSKYNFFGGNNRYTRISEGAGNVMSKWPDHISTCWVSIFIFIVIFSMMSLTFFAFSIHPIPLMPKCTPYNLNESNSKIYLMHSSDVWSPSEIEGVKTILENYPRINIEIVNLHNNSNKRYYRRRSHKINSFDVIAEKKGGFNKKCNRSLAKLIDENKNQIKFRNESMEDFFAFTPLYSAWRKLNVDLVEFAARTIMLWEYGGISLKLPKLVNTSNNSSNRFNASTDEEWKIEALMKSNLTTYTKLPKEVVNIDDEGMHMETKTQCHAYFGELLMNLRTAENNATTSSLIVKTLKTFCKSGAVNDDFCLNFTQNL